MAKKRISIYDIALEAGVSTATVSRVLTNSANVSEEKREKVNTLIKKYDYRPNAMARALSNTETKIIGLLTPDIRNSFYATLAIECERAAIERGYILLLSNSINNLEIERYHLQKMVEQRVDALILMGGKVDEIITDESYVNEINHISETTPLVITGQLDGSDCYQVNMDEAQATDILMEYLISNGHKDICLMGGRADVRSTDIKRICYKKALKNHGIIYNPDYIIETQEYTIESGYNAMNDLFDSKVKLPTAIVAINDFAALGIMKSIREHSYNIPEDISVVSFDNTIIAESTLPCLTTIGYNYSKFGEMLIETAISAIEGKPSPKSQKIMPKLFIRESCRRI